MRMGFASRFRGRGSVLSWRPLMTVITAMAVIVAMVVVAETAQRSEARHQAIQVLVERVRAASTGDRGGRLATPTAGGHQVGRASS